jgi:hypothetical protein
MNTSRKKVIGSLIGGIGLIETVGLMIRLLSNLAVIMLTPRSSGGGEYYDPSQGLDEGTNLVGVLFVMIPLLMLFYP